MASRMKSCEHCSAQFTGSRRAFCADCFTSVAKCYTCEKVKSLGEFNRHRGRPNGYDSKCRSCAAGLKLKLRYGITQSEYDAKAEAQQFECAICHKTRPLVLDHCHETGNNRGLLCSPCNSAIGLLGEDENVLLSAVQYLESHRLVHTSKT
ncbi:endonuclease VII [Gordonia phage Yvonnetastic]|uniref:Endonuclease VII n=1 Tax=Gordonia phage Yvonnetastic TaxID=1821566 RepID=A0A142K8Z9_9CAUD|nr:endonuclease VII [Gordonia phage Yvonnetastic]AMS02582.1 endonuclease VII [Gordonia phage Yvonnetastic]WKW86014.1 endonuclease VII [Gordonia Phage JonJames]